MVRRQPAVAGALAAPVDVLVHRLLERGRQGLFLELQRISGRRWRRDAPASEAARLEAELLARARARGHHGEVLAARERERGELLSWP